MNIRGFGIYCNFLNIAFEKGKIEKPVYFCAHTESICVGAPDYNGDYILDPNSPGELDVSKIQKCTIPSGTKLGHRKNITSKVF